MRAVSQNPKRKEYVNPNIEFLADRPEKWLVMNPGTQMVQEEQTDSAPQPATSQRFLS
jgi:hypothetical protein